MVEREIVRITDLAGPSTARVVRRGRGRHAVQSPVDTGRAIELEVRNLTHAVRARIRPDADAAEIAGLLREIVFGRLHLFWRVQRGDYPKGRRIRAPLLRAWIGDGPGSPGACAAPANLEVGLGSTGDVLAAIEALCRPRPSAADMTAVERLWNGYRFSRVIRAHREQAAASTDLSRTLQTDDP